jgi:hypothetical protein
MKVHDDEVRTPDGEPLVHTRKQLDAALVVAVCLWLSGAIVCVVALWGG